MSAKCYLIWCAHFVRLYFHLIGERKTCHNEATHPNFIMQYNKYIYHFDRTVQVFRGTYRNHVTLVFVDLLLSLSLFLVPCYMTLDSNTQGKNMCKLFKQFGQFGNTFNRGVLLRFAVIQRKPSTHTENHIFDVQLCSIFAKVSISFFCCYCCCSSFLVSSVLIGVFPSESLRKLTLMKYKCTRTKKFIYVHIMMTLMCVLLRRKKSMRSRKA